jgi:hypothetical protein
MLGAVRRPENLQRFKAAGVADALDQPVTPRLGSLSFADPMGQPRDRTVFVPRSSQTFPGGPSQPSRPRPGRQTDAAMVSHLADVLGRRGAVNAVRGSGEVDLNQADRAVRTRLNGQVSVWSSPLSTR